MSQGASSDDPRYMRRSLSLAERGWGRVAPNPLVGAVIVAGGEVVGEGYHAEYGQPHAEVEAIRAAGTRARGATLYVTLEPCSHHGKTPPCTEAIVAAGLRRVVFAAADPNPRAAGGAARLRAAGVEVQGGVAEKAARELNAPFFFGHTAAGAARPWIALKLALSLDARLADAWGNSAWITGEEARAEVHRLRAGFDAIAVGIGTALADDPRLTVRGTARPRRPPARVVFDRRLRLPLDGGLVRGARECPLIVVCGPDAPVDARHALESRGVSVCAAVDLSDGLRALREVGIASVLCEGGAIFAGALLQLDVVDRQYLFYTPLFLGSGGRPAFGGMADVPVDEARRWRLLESCSFGGDTCIIMTR